MICCGSNSCDYDNLEPSTLESPQLRRYSPLLESALLPIKDVVSGEWKAVPDIWKSVAEKYGDKVALVDPYHDPPSVMTYKELEQEILNFSEGLRTIGLSPDEKIALFADNSCRWLVADQGIMATGAVNVVRGSKSSDEEILQIYSHSESVAVVVDTPEFFNRLAEILFPTAEIRFIILLWVTNQFWTVRCYPRYQFLVTRILKTWVKKAHSYETIRPDDVATLVYTSGTSSTPKAVMLTHQNILHQIENLREIVPAEPGDRFLSMLPPWHMYERSAEYFMFSCGIQQVYTTVRKLKVFAIQKQISSSSAARKFFASSLIKISFLYMEAKRVYQGKVLTEQKEELHLVSVTLEWVRARVVAVLLWPLHTLATILVYRKIYSTIGIRKAGISGGGSLPMHIDRFFEAIGLTLQNGYGLTETSPVIAARRPDCNVLGTIGHPIKHTEIKVVDPETGQILSNGSKGIIKVRGPQVMKGYYKNSSSTNQALDKDGWFNTGDIGWIAPKNTMGRSRQCGGMIVIEGRAKDTIVLSSGENVEPSELEEAAGRSNLIKQIVVIGQDQRRLGALIVPDKEELVLAAKRLSGTHSTSSELSADEDIGRSFQIGPILILDEPFTIDNGLMTSTMKVRRDAVVDRYKDQIAKMYKKDI
ncbi:unnamed protein product [Spirodela intermedia]|uniref:4-coumarate--CoA ligase n=1 Tax=Spirodela intermedia TaxID=51605 RepID=A0A7I8IPR7_SPIIN|nr:unnamed protein product [Spirodela intermedia]CAA6659870.1 unnamed protein product [Spirodela intermedia]